MDPARYDGSRPEPPYNTDTDAVVMLQDELDIMTVDRDRLAAELQAVLDELARVRRNHLRRMGEATRERVVHMQNRLISRGIVDSYPHKRVIAEMNRFAEACRAALANNAKDET